ncbi:MAG: OFA family MFS transporter [Pseudomonadota bacterium]
MSRQVKKSGWLVAFSGTGINLALGILYTWSIFKDSIKQSIETGGAGAFTWDLSTLNDPYAVCCIVFAFAMILAGKCQDKWGPRITALVGGVLVGLGFILISRSNVYAVWIIGFGLLAGTGIGFGYSAATPPALKWFPPAKTGLIAGLVVAGFGLASVYIAPLSQVLLRVWGLQNAMLFFGIAFLVVVSGFSMMLVNPPPDYRMEEKDSRGDQPLSISRRDAGPSEMMKTRSFYTIWLIYFIGAGAGLMVIGSVAGMAKQSMGEYAFLAVAIMAIGNAAGRVIAGLLSDKIGRRATLTAMLMFQALLMLAAIPVVGSENTHGFVLVLLATLIGFNYGTNLSLFPSLTKDNWGLKNFGINYGIVFTAWGVGGFVMGRLSQMLFASAGTHTYSFLTAAVLLIIGAFLTFTLKGRKEAAIPHKKAPGLSYG